MITEIIYNGRNNTNELMLKADGVAQDITQLTKVRLDFNGQLSQDPIESTSSGVPYNWTTKGGDGILILELGGQNLNVGIYRNVELVIFDAQNTDGIFWGTFNLEVKDG